MKEKIKTGIKQLDQHLGGGFAIAKMGTIFVPYGVGKTGHKKIQEERRKRMLSLGENIEFAASVVIKLSKKGQTSD